MKKVFKNIDLFAVGYNLIFFVYAIWVHKTIWAFSMFALLCWSCYIAVRKIIAKYNVKPETIEEKYVKITLTDKSNEKVDYNLEFNIGYKNAQDALAVCAYRMVEMNNAVDEANDLLKGDIS